MEEYFKEEHNIFRKSLRDFVKNEINPIAEECERKAFFPKNIMPKLGALGCLGLRYPAEYGGSDADIFMSLVLAEELAYSDSLGIGGSILSHTDMSSGHVFRFGTDEQKRKFLVPAVKGETLFGIAVSEANAGSDVSGIQTTAKRDGDCYVLNGNKMFITNATLGDVLVVLAKTDRESGHAGTSLFIFETTTSGYEAGKLKKLIWHASDTGLVSFDNCRVPVENLLGREGEGFKIVMKGFENERLILSAMAISGAKRALDEAIRYASERGQFGRPIKDFQTIRHKLVDMAVQVEAGRQLTYSAAALLRQEKECKNEIMMAKLFTTEMAYRVASSAVQVHGGYGLMEEYAVSRLYRDLRGFSIGGGTSEIMRGAIGKGMGL